jgi:hypothetical protein
MAVSWMGLKASTDSPGDSFGLSAELRTFRNVNLIPAAD